ncbi:hypothetical protein M6B38_308680 [Iris pallida]|uniref:Uncharacterized protein n=1 Tax=Iris pallida TaxID=29817 RepID=A0AAX6HL14_IRIPA|nr:hypothetical protein M6B38_308680 [Iris pallida]
MRREAPPSRMARSDDELIFHGCGLVVPYRATSTSSGVAVWLAIVELLRWCRANFSQWLPERRRIPTATVTLGRAAAKV